LVDQGLINKLYQASNASVQIKLIIRGICSLVTGVSNQSENITAISIVDRFLEHPRVSISENNSQPKVYISSADWMSRNIDQRVEVTCPIYDPLVKQSIIDIITIQLSDNTKARSLDTKQTNQYQFSVDIPKTRAQIAIYHYLKKQQLTKTQHLVRLKYNKDRPWINIPKRII
jgi:polyphosphate kinase